MKRVIIAMLLSLFVTTGCDQLRGPTGPQGPKGEQGEPASDNIIKITGIIGSSRSNNFFDIRHSAIRSQDIVHVYVGISGYDGWGNCEYVYGNGYVWIHDPSGTLTGWKYIIIILPVD
ncbi:MAG: hypothetical protein U9N55_08030 [candidate division Zixibacteria bacterium]|nr:hypothetical protein [candidate division Zixibacteria bacterium]